MTVWVPVLGKMPQAQGLAQPLQNIAQQESVAGSVLTDSKQKR